MDNQDGGGDIGSEVRPGFCFHPNSSLGSAAYTLQTRLVQRQFHLPGVPFAELQADLIKDCLAPKDLRNCICHV